MEHSFFDHIRDFHISYQERKIEQSMTSQHYHNAYEFLLLMDGSRYIFLNNSMQEMKSRDLLILKPFVSHYTQTPPMQSFERFVFNSAEDYFDDIMTEEEQRDLFSGISTGIIHLDEKNYERILASYRSMYDLLAQRHTASKMKIFKMRAACFIQDVAEVSKLCPSSLSEPTRYKNSNLGGAIEYINKHYTEDITLDFITQYAHMSQSNFCLVFKKETGNTFLEYINRLRSTLAHKMLTNTNESVGSIALATGFGSVLQMDRMFKRFYNKTPKQMRMEIRKKLGKSEYKNEKFRNNCI